MTGQVIWITGLSGAGKTTVAEQLTLRIREEGLQPIRLDGDILRDLFKNSKVISETYNREARIKLAKKTSLNPKQKSTRAKEPVQSAAFKKGYCK